MDKQESKRMFIKNIIDDGFKESDFHKHMVLNRNAVENLSLLAGKTTAIMATYTSQIDCLMWSIFSLLMRSSDNLEHIIVCINGPDKRTGDPHPQDVKQQFLEELRSLKWHDRDMPITIARVWSRIGHGEAIEMAIPWVHTKAYTLVHDDVIVTNPTWAEESMQLLEDDEIAAVYNPPILGILVSTYEHKGGKKLNLPHINTSMVTCKKALIKERWTGYHVEKEFNISKDLDEQEFLDFYKGLIAEYPNKFNTNTDYNYLSLDFGTWVFYQLKSERYKLIPMRMAEHLLSMSWNVRKENLRANREHIAQLEMELINYPDYWELYKKYKTLNLFMEDEITYEGRIHCMKNRISPLKGRLTVDSPWEGDCKKKPWEYEVTAVIPVLDTSDTLKLVVEILRLQTIRPFIVIIDTGSCEEEYKKVEAMRDEDVEVHAIRLNGVLHPSDYPAIAMDLAFSMCRTEYLFATHSDCFLRRRDFIEYLLQKCKEESPVVGYRLTPRPHPDWEFMVSHTATMYHMFTMDKIGFGWSLRRLCNTTGIENRKPNSNTPNWPDTEVLGNYILKRSGIQPLFIGSEDNLCRNLDANIDHPRTYTSAKLYSPPHLEKMKEWVEGAKEDARKRIEAWTK